MNKCPLCNGKGKRIVAVPHKLSGSLKTSIEWCVCMKSRFVSDSPNCKILQYLGDDYLPLDKIDERLIFFPNHLYKSPNLFIYDTNFVDFCFHIKSVIIKYRFTEPVPLIYCSSAIGILHDFYVKQNDGSSPHLSQTNDFDLLIITMDTKEKNEPLKTCIAQVVYSRLCTLKPTWLYITDKVFNERYWEYSDDLNSYIEDKNKFTKIGKLAEINIKEKPMITKSKQSASNFGR